MEAILGIDFVLSNFFPITWRKMRSESSEYNNLLEKYQDLILKPFIHTHASKWMYSRESLVKNLIWNPVVICPQLI
jgi:succinate dehydrogenase flavin-adding protein (antitoxin of CptAB toxin-antitoxin module)